LADRLLSVGRTSDSEADGEELGEGATASGVAPGEGVEAAGVAVDSGLVVGVISGVAVCTGAAAGVVSGVAVGAGVVDDSGVAVASGVTIGVGDAVLSGVAWGPGVADDAGVAGAVLGAGVGELEGWPPAGAVGCCSQPARRRLVKARATTKHLIMPRDTDARGRGIFKPRCKGAKYRADCTIKGIEPSRLFFSVIDRSG
jgi:hypothetical protein